jgi:hypothetical protein
MDLLAYLDKKHGIASVLAKRHALSTGNFCVLQQLVENLSAQRRRFSGERLPQRADSVIPQVTIGVYAELPHSGNDLFNVNFCHFCLREIL